MDLNYFILSSSFIIFSYLNYKITLLEKELITYKMVDDILNIKITSLESNLKNLEEFRLKLYENNLSINRRWNDEEEDDDDD